MPSRVEQLQFILEGGQVQRFHSRPGIRSNTNAEHQWGVAMLCSLLWSDYAASVGPEIVPAFASVSLLMAALTHDLGEQYASDISAPAKRAMGVGDLFEAAEAVQRKKYAVDFAGVLTATEQQVLKYADMFDGMLYCCREAALGNRNVALVYARWIDYHAKLNAATYSDNLVSAAERLAYTIHTVWEQSNGRTEGKGPEFDVFS